MGEVIDPRKLPLEQRQALRQRAKELRFKSLCDPSLQARIRWARQNGMLKGPGKPKGAA